MAAAGELVAGLTYAGIGSRRTPQEVLALMTELAGVLASRGWVLRSGHAPGADQAFEAGAGAHAEIFLPWASFESAVPILADFTSKSPADAAMSVASQFHPGWEHLGRSARLFHARNCHQVLGRDLRSPVRFVVCWTPDGSLDGSGRDTGGTGQALRVAAHHRIPVFNLAVDAHLGRVLGMLTPA